MIKRPALTLAITAIFLIGFIPWYLHSSIEPRDNISQPAVHHAFKGIVGLAFGTLGHPHRVGHQLRHIVEKFVTGLHGLSSGSCA